MSYRGKKWTLLPAAFLTALQCMSLVVQRSLKDGIMASRAIALATDSSFCLSKRQVICIINLH